MSHTPSARRHLIQAPANLRPGTLRLFDMTVDRSAAMLEAGGVSAENMRRDAARARRIIAALPEKCPSPEVHITETGAVSMNWRGAMDINILATVRDGEVILDYPDAPTADMKGIPLSGPDDLHPVLARALSMVFPIATRPNEFGGGISFHTKR